MRWSYRIGGRWAHTFGGASGGSYDTLADGGLGDASFQVHATSDAVVWGWLAKQPVEIYEHGFLRWFGRVDEVDRDTGHVACVSRWEAGRDLPAMDGTGAATLNAATAITQAQAFGWQVNRNGVAGVVEGDSEAPMSVVSLLEMLAQQTGKRVGVTPGPGALLYLRTDPTVPLWKVVSPDARLSSEGEQTNAFAGRYLDSTTGRLTTLYWPSPLPSPLVMEPVDLTRFERITAAKAASVMAGAAALLTAGSRWTNELEVRLSQIQNMHGVSPSSGSVIQGGQMVQFPVSIAGRHEVGAAHLNVVLGRVTVSEGSDVVRLAPTGAADLSVAEAFERMGA